jgi:hypothetical protein
MKKMIFSMAMLVSVTSTAETGKEYVDESCLSCHGVEMFNREESKIKNKFDLRRQVSYCVSHLDVDWFPEDEQSVVKYLNDNFYKLEK